MPYLEIKLGPDTLLVPFVGRIDYVLGRLPKADIQLRDMKVSRLHTQLFIDSRGRAFVRDLGSSGGTVFNNQKLRSGAIAPLVMGTRLRIGDARITFYDQEPPVNAINPPSKSDPRGLIRTNDRNRAFHAEATVLAADKVSAETENGPAEAPPEIDPAAFADSAVPPSAKQPAAPAPGSSPASPAPKSGPQAKKPPARRDTGIVEAPWEAAESNRHLAPKGDKRVTIPPPTRGGKQGPAVPPPMQTAEIDETGKFHEAASPAPGGPTMYSPPVKPQPQRPVSPLPPRQPGAPVPSDPAAKKGTDFRAAKPAGSPSVRAPNQPLHEPEEMDLESTAQAFVPPPPPAQKPPAPATNGTDDEESVPATTGMPTVRLDRAALQARKEAEDSRAEAEAAAALKIPTATVRPDARPAPTADEPDEPAPRIGLAPGEKPPVSPLDEVLDDVKETASEEAAAKGADEEESLTDGQIAEYLGGSASGRFDAVDFGDESGKGDHEDEAEEVAINSKFAAPAHDDLDLDEPPPPRKVAQAGTSMLGNTTVVKAEPVEAQAVEAQAQEPQAAPGPAQAQAAPASDPAADAHAQHGGQADAASGDAPEEPIPEYKATGSDRVTPPPPSRTGAVADQGFKKPHKTRKLMKRRTEKITDRTHTPPPESKPTEMVPLPGTPGFAEKPVVGGAKTIFIPKPDNARISRGPAAAETKPPARVPEFAAQGAGKPGAEESEDDTHKVPAKPARVQDLGQGPGGDTVALPPNMMQQLRAELAKSGGPQETKPEAKPAPKAEPKPTIGESPTVKRAPDASDADDDEEFIIDDNYAFFTPPPPTRKAAAAAAAAREEEVIDANDFNAETDNLPPDKRAKKSTDPDTIVD